MLCRIRGLCYEAELAWGEKERQVCVCVCVVEEIRDLCHKTYLQDKSVGFTYPCVIKTILTDGLTFALLRSTLHF